MGIPYWAKIILYADISIFGILILLLTYWQIQVFRGKSMNNPDGSVDSWHDQKLCYGISLADLTIAVPFTLCGIILVFCNNILGYIITGMTSFWFVWINAATSLTSLKFEKPRLTFSWFLVSSNW